MDLHECECKKTVSVIGWGLCIFFVIINLGFEISAYISELIVPYFLYDVHNIISSTLKNIIYLAAFIVPALIIGKSLKNKGLFRPMKLEIGRLTGSSLLLIPISIWIISMAANINSRLLDSFGVSDIYSSVIGMTPDAHYTPYEIVLLFISSALVPAVAEEFLFRGRIIGSLKPYGKTFAVIFSALMFGLMHQNFYQLFYATIAGLVLGYAYVKTGSVWCPMLIHFCNNSVSVVNQVILGNCETEIAYLLIMAFNALVSVSGIVCLIIYVRIEIRRRAMKFQAGSFGQLLDESMTYVEKPIRYGNAKIYITPSIIVFTGMSIISAGLSFLSMIMMSIGKA